MVNKGMKMSKQFVLVREDRSILQSYVVRCRFKQKAAAERQAKKLTARGYGELVVMELGVYLDHGYGNLTRKVRNIMTGDEVEENINTPYSCSVSSESYWCN